MQAVYLPKECPTKIGTQTFGLGKELSSDFSGTIQELHDIGFDTIEPFILFQKKQGRLPKNLWSLEVLSEAQQIMKELDMTIPSMHIGVGFGRLSMPAQSIIKKIITLQEQTEVSTFVVSGPFGDVLSAKKWGKLLGKISEGVRPYGCTILCHNHNDEFHKINVNGRSTEALDYFFELAGPNVLLQLDIGWAGFAKDEVSAARHYADRICSLHLKDFYPGCRSGGYTRTNIPAGQFAPIGEGIIKTAEILAMRNIFPHFNGNLIIDQDKSAGEMMETLKTGYENCRKLLV